MPNETEKNLPLDVAKHPAFIALRGQRDAMAQALNDTALNLTLAQARIAELEAQAAKTAQAAANAVQEGGQKEPK